MGLKPASHLRSKHFSTHATGLGPTLRPQVTSVKLLIGTGLKTKLKSLKSHSDAVHPTTTRDLTVGCDHALCVKLKIKHLFAY